MHDSACSFLERSKKKIISPVSVLELAAVVSRLEAELEGPEELLHESSRRRVRALVEFFIKDSNLFLASIPAHPRIKIDQIQCLQFQDVRKTHAPMVLQRNRQDASSDLAYADSLRKWGQDIEVFVTGDKEILKNSDSIQRHLRIEVTESSERL